MEEGPATIEKASFRNFKSLRHVDIDLERLTVIVGPNASGKTSILEGLHLVLQAMPMPKPDLEKWLTGVRNPRWLYSRGAQAERMEICCHHANTSICLRVGFPLPLSGERLPGLPDTDAIPGWYPEFVFNRGREQDPAPTVKAIRQQFGSSSLLKFSAPILASPPHTAVHRILESRQMETGRRVP